MSSGLRPARELHSGAPGSSRLALGDALAAFRRWDTQGASYIKREEIRRVLVVAGVPEVDIETGFSAADRDKDGRVSYEDFLAWLSGTGREAATLSALTTYVNWPVDPDAFLAPEAPADVVEMDAPVPCKDGGIAYWSVGGPAKGRVRVLEDKKGALKLGQEYTVAVRFRLGRTPGPAKDYDTLLMGHDNKHWLAVRCDDRRLMCMDSKTGTSSTLGAAIPIDEWTVVFLQSRGEGQRTTGVFTFDGDGLLDAGNLEMGLHDSKLEKMGWAKGEVHLAEVVIWKRSLRWAEMAAAVSQRALPPPLPPPPSAPSRPQTSFRGQVTDTSGKPVADVRVAWGKGFCVTDEDGDFAGSLSDAETDLPEEDGASGAAGSTDSGSTVLSFSCDGFAPTCAHAPASSHGSDSCMQVVLRQISASTLVRAAEGGSVIDASTGSSLLVPPNTLVYPDGSQVDGPVTVSLSVIDVTDPVALASMPGDFSAVGQDGAAVYLQSLGAAWVGATDAEGREVTVREGSEGVTLDLKSKASADATKLGADAELWAFDEISGKWQLLDDTPLKVDGETAPNSAATRSAVVESDSDGEGYRKGSAKAIGKTKMGKMRMKRKAKDPSSKQLVTGCMSPEDFRAAVARDGEKSLSTTITKFGYINCDLAYHHPQRAVMLTGRVIDIHGTPVPSVQLWAVGKDYEGRTPDATDKEGKFGAMISQFDSKVEVEVHMREMATDDAKVEVFFDEKAWDEKWMDKLPKDLKKILPGAIQGKYKKASDLVDGRPVWAKKEEKGQTANRIAWCEARHQWHHVVGNEVVLVKDEDGEAVLPYGAGWRYSAAFGSRAEGAALAPPTYARAWLIVKQSFGPFKTGPPGEFVDVGELKITCAASPSAETKKDTGNSGKQ